MDNINFDSPDITLQELIFVNKLRYELTRFEIKKKNLTEKCKEKCNERFSQKHNCIHKEILLKYLCKNMNLVISLSHVKLSNRDLLYDNIKKMLHNVYQETGLIACKPWYLHIFKEIPNFKNIIEYKPNYSKCKYFDTKTRNMVKIYKKKELQYTVQIKNILLFLYKGSSFMNKDNENITYWNSLPDEILTIIRNIYMKLIQDELLKSCYNIS